MLVRSKRNLFIKFLAADKFLIKLVHVTVICLKKQDR